MRIQLPAAGRRPWPEAAENPARIAAFCSRKASVWPIGGPHGYVLTDTRHALTLDLRPEIPFSAVKAMFFVLADRSSPVIALRRSDA